VFSAFVVLEFDPSAKFTLGIFHILFYFISFALNGWMASMMHVKCAGLTGRVKDFIDLNSGLMWSCGSCKEMVVEMSGFMKQTRDSLLNLSGGFKQLNEGFNSVCAQFNNKILLTPKRKKASLAAVNTIMVSTPNPNLVAAAVSVDTGVSEPTANMDTAYAGGVNVSRSLVVKKCCSQ